MTCKHERTSGRLRLLAPVRVLVLAVLVCDDCNEDLEDLGTQSAEASVVQMLALWSVIKGEEDARGHTD